MVSGGLRFGSTLWMDVGAAGIGWSIWNLGSYAALRLRGQRHRSGIASEHAGTNTVTAC